MNDLKTIVIGLCDRFLQGEISKSEIQSFADSLISTIDDLSTDENLVDTIYSWEDAVMNFPITRKNIELWKLRLQTGEDHLEKHNVWSVHIDPQRAICKKYDSDWLPVNKRWTVGVNLSNLNGPINGLRHPKSEGNEGWYIWKGDYQTYADFFKPICAEHLLQMNPAIVRYLGLKEGFRFQIDDKGYGDVWFDEELLGNGDQ